MQRVGLSGGVCALFEIEYCVGHDAPTSWLQVSEELWRNAIERTKLHALEGLPFRRSDQTPGHIRAHP